MFIRILLGMYGEGNINNFINRKDIKGVRVKFINKVVKGENYYCCSDKFIFVFIVILEKSKEER